MFGIKIIKESEYNDLVQCALRHYEAHKKECVAYERTKKDCASLREQLNEKMTEVNKLHEENNNYLREVKSLRELSVEYGISDAQVSRIANGKSRHSIFKPINC